MRKSIGKLFGILLIVVLFFTAKFFAQDSRVLTDVGIKTTANSLIAKNKIENNIDKLVGVEMSRLDMETKELKVKFDPKLTSSLVLVEKVRDMGYYDNRH